MNDINIAKFSLRQGMEFPYDASDEWWEDGGSNPPPSADWAHKAARCVLANLQDRSGIKHGFAGLDEDIRSEIVSSLADIIRLAAPAGEPS